MKQANHRRANFQVKCYDHETNSTDVKYLGISIDKYLNCEHIVSSIINKVNSRLKFVYRNAKCLDTRSRMTLTTALIQCYFDYSSHPTTGYLDNRCYRELRSYLRHTEWQVGISLTFFFHFIYSLDFIFMSDLLHYKWEICIPNMTVLVLIFSNFSINGDRIWRFQQRILQNINVFSKISKESTRNLCFLLSYTWKI